MQGNIKIRRHQGLLFAFLLFSAPPAGAGSYHYTTIKLPTEKTSEPAAISDKGEVVGYFSDANYVHHGFVWYNGLATQVDANGATQTGLVAINGIGIAAGNYGVSNTCSLAFTYDTATGQQTTIGSCPTGQDTALYAASINRSGAVAGSGGGVPGCTTTVCGFIARGGSIVRRISAPGAGSGFGTLVAGINDHNELTGHFFLADGSEEGFTFGSGAFTKFDLFDDATDPAFITNDGTVGGSLFGDGTPQTLGFTLNGNTATSFAYPDSEENSVVGIGPAGEVVGTWSGTTASHGFTFLNGTYYSIDFPGATQTYLTGVNAQGTLVGYFTKSTHRHPIYHAFIAHCPAAEQPCTQ
jgi:probable HAF family extracellular repeat protein